jgi:hypothetical protein
MSETQELQSQHELGRAKNSVQSFLIRKLLVPKVYLDENLGGESADVLAVDRAGIGDVHAVRLVPWEPSQRDDHGWSVYLQKRVTKEIEAFIDFPGHFKYLAIVCSQPGKQPWLPSEGMKNQALAADGVGRIGFLYLNASEEEPEVKILLKAERFRSSKELVAMADRFVADHNANWEVRDEPDVA